MKKWEYSKKMSELGRKGGVSRSATLTPERRKEIARQGGLARQKKLRKEMSS